LAPAPRPAERPPATGHDFAGRPAPAGPAAATAAEKPPPQLALLGTDEDRPSDWLRAGQAMERVLLEATAHGLSTGLSSTPLTLAEPSWAPRDAFSPIGQVHVVLRIGYGPTVPPVPRLPVSQVLRID
ncbi:nitroreductase, partial [Streptomyces sp. DSM 44917]|nr:nitroreductase [Streptomyces sp. DSM 44917]